ncbi:MAG: type I DNA topoisomerase [Saprospiraceae bacterium]|nr:type I DNA topoisomerase [Saprospiraceae bacterium]
MSKHLVIVESPAKAKTIENILKKIDDNDYVVTSSVGHIRDLPKSGDAIDIANGFKPKYVISPEKAKTVKELKSLAKKVDEILLATDEDREGEAISWHLCKVLKLDENTTKRIVFREITAPAIKKAIANPRTLDLSLVDAQQARRLLDRLVGFELSEVLWKKVKGNLSAGRVQSVAVKLIVDKEREIQKFDPTNFYKVEALFNVENQHGKQVELKAELKRKIDNKEEAQSFLETCKLASYSINNIQVKPSKRKPPAPFTTSTLQQEASRKLGFAVKRTMSAAQSLYEKGFITYMRTDSITLSDVALSAIEKQVVADYGEKYHQFRRFKNKNQNAQEAHEAIRPTYIDRKDAPTDRDQKRLYDLIRLRTLACQMSDAVIEKTIVDVGISTNRDEVLVAEGQMIKFDGYLKIYLEGKDNDDEDTKGMLPPLREGQALSFTVMTAKERFTKAAARFTEATLVKKLEELGIGRPSTYASTIGKIMEVGRGYVVKDSREGTDRQFQTITLSSDNSIAETQNTERTGVVKNRLFSTDMGIVVTDFLEKHFDNIMNFGFTKEMEERFDLIASGKENWVEMLEGFYHSFHNTVLETIEKADRASGERILGKDPETGRTVLVRMTKFGRPVVQIGKPEELGEEEKPKYANLKAGQSMEELTDLEEALDLFQLPKSLEPYKGMEVTVASGRFGPYIRFGEKYVSIPRTIDPMTIGQDKAEELIELKIQEDAPVAIYQELPVTQGKGRFGPFLKWNKMFINISKKYDPDNLSTDDINELISAKVEKEANRYIHRWADIDLAVENGRWGPFIRFKKKSIKLPKNAEGKRMTAEEAVDLTLDAVKAYVSEEIPNAFGKKKAAPKKKAPAKKKTTTKK